MEAKSHLRPLIGHHTQDRNSHLMVDGACPWPRLEARWISSHQDRQNLAVVVESSVPGLAARYKDRGLPLLIIRNLLATRQGDARPPCSLSHPFRDPAESTTTGLGRKPFPHRCRAPAP